MKSTEVHGLADPQVVEAVGNARQEIFNLRFQSATGALENSARVGGVKREIARILTIRHQRAATVGRT